MWYLELMSYIQNFKRFMTHFVVAVVHNKNKEKFMKYLIRANKVVFSGNLQMIMKYVSDFYKSESKLWTDKNGNFTDLGKFKTFIESMNYKIIDKIPNNCRCEGTAISNAEFKQICGEEHYNLKAIAQRLHITEKLTAQLMRKLKIRK